MEMRYVFEFTRMQTIAKITRRMARRVSGSKSEYLLRLSEEQDRNITEVYVGLPAKLKEVIPWDTVVDGYGQIRGLGILLDVICVCKYFKDPTREQQIRIERFVEIIDTILDIKRDYVIDELIQLYPTLRWDIRDDVSLDEGIIDNIETTYGRVHIRQWFNKKMEQTRRGFRESNSITEPEADAITFLRWFIYKLDEYPDTCCGPNRRPYHYYKLAVGG